MDIAQQKLIDITVEIHIARMKLWPESEVKESAEIAREIMAVNYEDNLRKLLHNLTQDYDSLQKKYRELVVKLHESSAPGI